MSKKEKISLTFFILFLISGIVFIALFFTNNIADSASARTGGLSDLRNMQMYYTVSMASFAASAILLVLFLVERKFFLNTKLFAVIFATIIIIFGVTSIPSIVSAVNGYEEYSVFTDMYEYDTSPGEENKKFFPYYDTYEDRGLEPYYSLTKETINNSKYISTQLFSDLVSPDEEDVNTQMIDIDYFKTDKGYLMSKYISEKMYLYIDSDTGETIPDENIKNGNAGSVNYSLIKSGSVRFVIQGDNYYFSIYINDDNLTDDDIISLGLEQFEIMKSF